MAEQLAFAPRTRGMGANAIREILKVTSQPGMRSLAGGIPAPEVFPMEAIARLSEEAIQRWGTTAFQYGLTEGFGPLREQLVGYLATKGVSTSAEEVTITSGSQGALAALGIALYLVAAWDPDIFWRYAPRYASGLWITIKLVGLSVILGGLLSIPIAIARRSGNRKATSTSTVVAVPTPKPTSRPLTRFKPSMKTLRLSKFPSASSSARMIIRSFPSPAGARRG